MKKKEAKKKIQWQQYIAVAFFMLIGAVCGVLMAQYVDKNAKPGTRMGKPVFASLFICGNVCCHIHTADYP